MSIRAGRSSDCEPPRMRFLYRTTASTRNIRWQSNGKGWDGGFGRQILGETWINHHGHHGSQSTRGLIAPGMADNPILRGIKDGDIWGPTDVYEVRLPLPADCKPLIMGEVLTGMKPTDPPEAGKQNDPMMPVAWIKTVQDALRARRESVLHHDGRIARSAKRRAATACWSTPVIGDCRAGGQDHAEVGCGSRWRLSTDPVRFWWAPEREQAGRFREMMRGPASEIPAGVTEISRSSKRSGRH